MYSMISIHTLHTESDLYHRLSTVKSYVISIHTLHTESDVIALLYLCKVPISIHTLHTESDNTFTKPSFFFDISIHTLHTESDIHLINKCILPLLFQSTLSIQRVTFIIVCIWCSKFIISIHTLHTESDKLEDVGQENSIISIHTLHTESDCNEHYLGP